MLTIAAIISSRKRPCKRPADEDLRHLPYRNAFIYGRVSSPGQVRDSHESIREIAKLVKLSKEDGYKTGISPEEVEEWLHSIVKGTASKKTSQDGEITTQCFRRNPTVHVKYGRVK